MTDLNSKLNPIQRLTALLGENGFFVPCEWRTKKPLSSSTLRLRLSLREDARYRIASGVTHSSVFVREAIREGRKNAFGLSGEVCQRSDVLPTKWICVHGPSHLWLIAFAAAGVALV